MDLGSDPRVRPLLTGDVPAALELSHAAGWNQTADDWLRLLRLEPEGCFGIDCDGRLAATATVLCYGTDLAWIGMVLTHRDYQRRGYARRLMEATLRVCERRGIACVKLDATDQGRPLYASMGFEDEQPIERWRRDAHPARSEKPDCRFDAAADQEAFGCDRSRFLEALDFAVQRPGTRARYFGPFVSRDPIEAERVIGQVVGSREEPWFWDLLPAHPHAARIAGALGFSPVRRLVRMSRGGSIRTNDSLVYAIGGFEAG